MTKWVGANRPHPPTPPPSARFGLCPLPRGCWKVLTLNRQGLVGSTPTTIPTHEGQGGPKGEPNAEY